MYKAKAIIRKVGNEYCVFSHDGKNLGCSTSHDDAVKRLQQVEYFKHKGSSMNYDKAFTNFARALNNIDPTEVGKAPTAPQNITEAVSVETELRVGSLAGRRSDRVLDKKDHFPIITQTQAQSSMARVLQLTTSPVWYNGTLAELRQDVYDGVLALHPKIQLNIRVPVEQAVALSDGQTPAETSQTSVKDPADVAKDLVPQVKRPTLTSAQVEEALADEETRKIVAGRLMEMIDQQVEQLDSARKLAGRLLKNGIKAEEFDQLSTFVQQDILRELLSQSAIATVSTEDRRRELLNRLSGKGE